MTTRDRAPHGLTSHVLAVLAALLALPWVLRALHIGGDQYGSAWGLIGLAWLLHWRTGWWIAWTALIATIAGALTDLPVLHDSVTYLTGAAW